MKKKELQELRTKTTDELKKLILDLEHEMKRIKADMIIGKLKDINSLKTKKKHKARLLTFLKGGKS